MEYIDEMLGFRYIKDKDMKAGWFFVSNDDTLSGFEIKKLYGKRFSYEETFRDLKSSHRGWGMSQSRIKKDTPDTPQRQACHARCTRHAVS